MTTSQTVEIDAINYINEIIENNGPEESQYREMENCFSAVSEMIENGILSTLEVAEMILACKFLHTTDSIMGHIRQKPYGYAGDFEIIEKIYQQVNRKEEFKKWDEYSLQHPAAVAVRNRKKYFVKLIEGRLQTKKNLELLNIASGPGRDLFEAYRKLGPGPKLTTQCVEMDTNAIAFAQALNHLNLDHITFINQNIFRFRTEKQFDMIWSAGLFDYFEDKMFVRLLTSFSNWLKPGGEMIIGNFNEDHNPSRLFMEMFGDWHLNHRSESHLIDLATQAGFRKENIWVGHEEENINLFLHIRKSEQQLS